MSGIPTVRRQRFWAKERTEQRELYDRDAQEMVQYDAMMDAAQKAAEAQVRAEDNQQAARRKAFEERQQATDYREVFERKAAERIQERRDYWQLDQLEKEHAAAQKNLDDHSGWIYRYVFRSRHREAQDQLDNAQRNLDERRDAWARDIVAIHDGRPDTLTIKALRDHGFEPEADLLSELVRARQQLRDKQLGDVDQVIRDQRAEEQAQYREGIEALRDRPQVQTRTPELDHDFQGATQKPEPKLQRDMSPEELEALRDELFEQMQAKLSDQSAGLHEGYDEDMPEQQNDLRLGHDDDEQNEDKLQRDMDEAELQAAKESVRQRIAEASYGFEDDEVAKGGNEPEIEQ